MKETGELLAIFENHKQYEICALEIMLLFLIIN